MQNRGRLFWKILLGFWLIFLLMTQLLWVGFALYGDHRESPEESMSRRLENLQLDSAASVIKSGGLPALQSLMADWRPEQRRIFSFAPVDGTEPPPVDAAPPANAAPPADMAGLPLPPATRLATAPDGKTYLLKYDREAVRRNAHSGPRGSILHMPSPLFWLGMMVGLLFSLLLAWNLSRPMRQLRQAFARVAQGDLTVRLYPVMRRRHDEITDVARDFDAMAERLHVLVSAREVLLHDVSHELRSPLARLQLAIGLAHQNPGNVDSSLDRIEQEAGRLDKMIGELLALSRSEYQDGAGEDYFDLLGLVEAVVNDARYEAQVPGVEIRLNADQPEDYTVKGNAEMMRRGFENIIRNALRFSSHGQRVDVALSRSDGLLIITVSDQGPGVDEDKLSSMFDPFVRVNSPMMGKGYGLGLAITRKVVLAHGGQVEAYNGAGGGLVIRVAIPRWRR
ncbi:ATP-binding protein [Martelella alba]|uniref:histidine kinase n=1 Tax=Martelella alba TaxID=2590451 RepID=A0ABY2SFV0_9HYPH|nr:ATP-binding protein [Martelella alba]TKI03214.1 HAMP domain-containing protein [Martelella alba]